MLLRIEKHKAFLRGAEWRCAHLPLEEELNRFTRRWVHYEATNAELAGDLELRIAEQVAARFGGKSMRRVESARPLNAKAYFNLRQLDLFG